MRDRGTYHKELREDRKVNGICIQCGTRKAATGRSRCQRDLDRAKASQAKSNSIKKQKGICINCNDLAQDDNRRCQSHIQAARKTNNEANQRKKLGRLEQGLCPQCGVFPPRRDMMSCTACGAKSRVRQEMRAEIAQYLTEKGEEPEEPEDWVPWPPIWAKTKEMKRQTGQTPAEEIQTAEAGVPEETGSRR